MFKRIFCVLCALLLLASCAAAEEAEQPFSCDFDLTFSLNTEAFSPILRGRAKGYADMLGCIRVKGNFTWSEANNSFELTGTLFYKDKPDVSVPFRVFGLPGMLYFTSPAINDEIILLNMSAFLEFAAKAKENLGVPLPYFAFFYPHTTEFSFGGMVAAWENIIGPVTESREVLSSKIDRVAKHWENEMEDNLYLSLWINTLASGSDCPEAVTTEFGNLPYYPNEYVTHGKALTVTIENGTETWQNDVGHTLFFREETDHSLAWTLSLPETESRYKPYCSFLRESDGNGCFSFRLDATYLREAKEPAPTDASAAGNGEKAAEEVVVEDGEEILVEEGEEILSEDDENPYREDSDSWPDRILEISVSGSGIPEKLPADTAFSVSVLERGALFPNVAFLINGETKSDGSAFLSVRKPAAGGNEAVEVFRMEGTVVPVEPPLVPEYRGKVFHGAYNLFSMNEEKVGRLKKDIMPGLLGTTLNFVAEAPASFVQSFLDDFTDLGLLGLFANQ